MPSNNSNSSHNKKRSKKVDLSTGAKTIVLLSRLDIRFPFTILKIK